MSSKSGISRALSIGREITRRRSKKMAKQKAHLESPEVQNNLEGVVTSLRSYLKAHNTLFDLVRKLERLVPEDGDKYLTIPGLKSVFCTGFRYDDLYDSVISINPPVVGLVTLHQVLSDKTRFEHFDPRKLPEAKELETPYVMPKIVHTTVDLVQPPVSVPANNEVWVRDIKTNVKMIITYDVGPGGLSLSIAGSEDEALQIVELSKELKMSVLKNPMIRGQIIEIIDGNGIRIMDNLGDQPEPIIDENLKYELEKNVVNLFDKEQQFRDHNLPISRSVILAGPPGCGKTMIEKWLATKVRGKVTTIWVTAKSISGPGDVAAVFEIARKLSPSLVVMEDLDLIAGTRNPMNNFFGNTLGEMLNQLDGLSANESIVLVGSTNKVSSLDEALSDRPGRFDRIFEVSAPSPENADRIARKYLGGHGVPKEVIDTLSLKPLLTGDFTGAQIVEIVKGALFEAIHRGTMIDELCVKASCRGLQEQGSIKKKY